MKPRLTIGYADFWPGHDPEADPLTRLLGTRREVVLSPSPELLFFSAFGRSHLRHRCHRVFYTGENIRPDLRLCDFALSFAESSERNCYLPLFVRYPYFEQLRTGRHDPTLAGLRATPADRFCNFIYSNEGAGTRKAFCRLLQARRPVDCPGRVLNNMAPVPDGADRWWSKIEFLARYRFTIAFENESTPGYATEKITDAFLAGSIPIYWGDPGIAGLFNPESFVNCHAYPDFEAVVRRVLEIENDPAQFERMRNAPPVLPGSGAYTFDDDYLGRFLDRVLDSVARERPIASRWRTRLLVRGQAAGREAHRILAGIRRRLPGGRKTSG